MRRIAKTMSKMMSKVYENKRIKGRIYTDPDLV